MIGREGVVGLPVVLGNGDRFSNEIYMQIAGSGQRLSANAFREAIGASVTLHQVMLCQGGAAPSGPGFPCLRKGPSPPPSWSAVEKLLQSS